MKELIYKNNDNELILHDRFKLSDDIKIKMKEKIIDSTNDNAKRERSFVLIVKDGNLVIVREEIGSKGKVSTYIEAGDVGAFHTHPTQKEDMPGANDLLQICNEDIVGFVGTKYHHVWCCSLRREYIKDKELREKLKTKLKDLVIIEKELRDQIEAEDEEAAKENFYKDLFVLKEKYFMCYKIMLYDTLCFKIDKEQFKKVEKWLSDIRIEDMNFPKLSYMFTVLNGTDLTATSVKEHVTNEELDLGDKRKLYIN